VTEGIVPGFYRSKSLWVKTNVVFFLALTLLATLGAFSWKESRRLAEKDKWISHTRDVLETSESLRSHLSDAGGARRAYLIREDPKQAEAFNAAKNLALSDFEALRKLTTDPLQQARLDQVEPLVRSRLAIFEASIRLEKRNPNDTKTQDIYTDQGGAVATPFIDKIHEFEAIERELLRGRTAEAQAGERRATRVQVFLGLSVLLFLTAALVALNREIARGMRAESAVGNQRKLLESILNSCSDYVLVGNSSGAIILCNPTAEETFKGISKLTSPAEYVRLLGFYKPDKVTFFPVEDLPLGRTVRGESVDGVEMYVRKPGERDGRYYLAAGRPLLNERGERNGGVVFLRDITALKLAEQELKAALDAAEMDTRDRTQLSNLADFFQSCETVEEACKVIESVLPPMFGGHPGSLCLTNSSRNLLETVATWNGSSSEVPFAPSECWALRLGKAYPEPESRLPMRCAHVNVNSTGEHFCVPLMAQGETLGVLCLEYALNPFAAPEVLIIERRNLQRRAIGIAERISLALANLKLREVLRHQSVRDPLTGLFNRRYLEESLEREIHRANRTHRQISFVMLDLDHFKRFNDTFGHQAGDMLLREVAGVIKSGIRAGDLACRYGGEEFALIISEADSAGAAKCVENLREAIRHLSLTYRGQVLGAVTLSAGIAAFPISGEDPADLIQAADAALYQAKKEGRNRICEASRSQLADKNVIG
jgi:diguanylate cyclase (GGDEF)-like protein